MDTICCKCPFTHQNHISLCLPISWWLPTDRVNYYHYLSLDLVYDKSSYTHQNNLFIRLPTQLWLPFWFRLWQMLYFIYLHTMSITLIFMFTSGYQMFSIIVYPSILIIPPNYLFIFQLFFYSMFAGYTPFLSTNDHPDLFLIPPHNVSRHGIQFKVLARQRITLVIQSGTS